jgi:hypothetical protein
MKAVILAGKIGSEFNSAEVYTALTDESRVSLDPSGILGQATVGQEASLPHIEQVGEILGRSILEHAQTYEVVNERKYAGNIRISLGVSIPRLEALERGLQKAGLQHAA